MKTITAEQVEAVLQTVYQTNITAQAFDALRKFLSELPDAKVEDKKAK